VLSLRNEKAKLLDFKNYADLSMASKVGVVLTVTSLRL
jgi:Zn-dependent oligopeptidase